MKIVPLNISGSAWVEISHTNDDLLNFTFEKFDQMWNSHPENRHKIINAQREMEVHRYSKSYLNTPPIDLDYIKSHSYMYSSFDTSSNNDELPDNFKKYYEYIKSIDDKYNQVIANWYENGSDYIAAHSDCKRGMIPNGKIAILSLYSDDVSENEYRNFEIIPVKTNTESLKEKFIFKLSNGMIITMCGDTQENYRHCIPPDYNNFKKRISLSFRQMENFM